MNEAVFLEVGGADSKNDDINYKPPHNGKPITKIGISPEEKYLVTYSPNDYSIFGWSIDKGELNPDNYRYDTPFGFFNGEYEMEKICVSDDEKLAYIYRNYSNRCCLGK